MLQRVRPGVLRLVFAALVLVSVGSGAMAAAQEADPTASTTPTVSTVPSVPTTPTVPSTEGRTVRVAIRQLPPFVEKHGDHYTGLTIELWERIASENGWKTEYVEVDNVNAMLEAVADGRADVAATAISVTSEREDRFDFSHPYFQAGLQIMVPADRVLSFGSLFHALTSPSLQLLFCVFLGGLLVVGAIVALIERRSNPDFAHFGPRAVLEGAWWGLTTASTVGYGDRVTRTGVGRIIAAFWIIFGVIFLAQVTASVTASLTGRELRSDIRGPQDLGGHDVVTVRGTTAATYLREHRIKAREVASVDEMVDAVADGKADAAVYDAPVLAYQVGRVGPNRVALVGTPFTSEFYAIATAPGSDLLEPIDRSLLQLSEDGLLERLRDAWFPS